MGVLLFLRGIDTEEDTVGALLFLRGVKKNGDRIGEGIIVGDGGSGGIAGGGPRLS